MATYIDFCPEQEQALELAKYVNKLKNKDKTEVDESFVKEAEKLIGEKNIQELLKNVLGQAPLIFKEGTEKEIESFFFVLLALVKKLDHESARQFTSNIVSTLISPSIEEKSLLRLKLLSNVYNIFDQNPTSRFEIFIALTKFAKSTHHTDLIVPHFKDIEKRVAEWGITMKEKRDLYKSIRDALRESKKSIEAHQWSTKYLATFEGGNYDSETQIAEEAVNAALDAIRLRDLYQFDDLLELHPIKQLANSSDANQAQLYQLLKIFVGETIEAYTEFASKNAALFQKYGLNQQDCTDKMRLLSLASLAAGAATSNNEVTYSLIAKTLQIDENEVEMYVVSAISEKILAAKMDQIKKVITVSYSIQRVFTATQWKQLSDQLAVWTENVKLLAKTLGDCKQTASSALANAAQQQQ